MACITVARSNSGPSKTDDLTPRRVGDLRHRTAVSTGTPLSRGQWERRELAAKYAPGPAPAVGILTDTAP
ncbi:hypothetical protein [Streptomyces tubercidicus]